jgi:SAM-dependent methyltransferase
VAEQDRLKIKSFWDNASKSADTRFGSHSDPNIEALENWFVVRYGLEGRKVGTLLDVGCGKGERTRYLSSFVTKLTLGIDYSEGMIKLAKRKENPKLKFRTADILNRPDLGIAPDVIVSCRCLINLGNGKNVETALEFFQEILPKGGRLVFLEASEEGHVRLNNLRLELGLEEIRTAWYNINLSEKKVEKVLGRRSEKIHKSRFGLYYLLTRGIYPAAIRPKKPDPNSKINEVARGLQEQAGIGTLEEFGRHYCAVFQKR